MDIDWRGEHIRAEIVRYLNDGLESSPEIHVKDQDILLHFERLDVEAGGLLIEEIRSQLAAIAEDSGLFCVSVPRVAPRYLATRTGFQTFYEKEIRREPKALRNLNLFGRDFLQEVLSAHLPDFGNADNSLAIDFSIPASDRYVRVTDNQKNFETLSESLDRIRNEFSKDHNKSEFGEIASEIAQASSEIAATQAQIATGVVRKGLLAFLGRQLRRLLEFAKAWPGLHALCEAALNAINDLLEALGS